MLFVPGGYTAELQPADISIQQPLTHSIKQQAMELFAESVCRDEAVLDLRLGTMERLLAHWVLHACTDEEKNTNITTKAWRHLSWTFAEAPGLAASANREHLNGTRFEETSFSMTTMTMLRIPRARAHLLQRQSCRSSRVERAERFIHRIPEHQLFSRRCGTECVLASCRCCARVWPLFQPLRSWRQWQIFKMLCGRAIGHGLCDLRRQGVPHSSRTLFSVRSHARCTDALNAMFSFVPTCVQGS